jgi:hypothetical protein
LQITSSFSGPELKISHKTRTAANNKQANKQTNKQTKFSAYGVAVKSIFKSRLTLQL